MAGRQQLAPGREQLFAQGPFRIARLEHAPVLQLGDQQVDDGVQALGHDGAHEVEAIDIALGDEMKIDQQSSRGGFCNSVSVSSYQDCIFETEPKINKKTI